MSAYSHMDLASKMMCYKTALQLFTVDESLPCLDTFPKVNTLIAIKTLNKRKKPANSLSINFLLRANQHGISYADFDLYTGAYISAGLIRRGAGKGSFLYITEAGKAALLKLDEYLRRSVIKVSVKDRSLRTLPGPKKGRSMPNRWPAGKPKGRTPRSQGGK